MPHSDSPQPQGAGGPDPGPSLAVTLMQARPEREKQVPTPPRLSEEDGEEEGENMEFDQLPKKWQRVATAIREAAEEHGPFSKGKSGYMPQSMRGQKCKGCVFYDGGYREGKCSVVKGSVREDAVCNLHVKQK